MTLIVEELEIKKQFGKFLKGYVLKNHTVDLPTMDEVDKLTDDFLNSIDTNFYFDELGVRDYVEYLKIYMNDENKHFLNLVFNKSHYVHQLEDYVKYYIKKIIRLKP